jgi:DNA-binding beta-propeller fold protein YncE
MRLPVPALLTVFASGLAAASNCNTPPPAPQTIDLPGYPFHTAITGDGCWIFAAVSARPNKTLNGIAVLSRTGGRVELVRSVLLDPLVLGLALTHDGRLLIGANQAGITLLDVASLISGQGDPVVARVPETPSGSVYVNVTRDGRTIFLSEEGARAITVIDLPRARQGQGANSIVGRIPVGNAPIALTFSRNEKLLYTTSQSALPEWGWEAVCDPENPNAQAPVKHPEGAVIVVDVLKARTDPEHSMVARVHAACNPVRLALSPRGDRAYVTARKTNAVLAFDTKKLVSDPDNARVASVPVGMAPVPVIALRRGKRILAGNSNRFAGGGDAQSLTVVDAKKIKKGSRAVIGSIPAGAFPRSLQTSPDGRTLILANFMSATLQIMDTAHLPIKHP